jgi:hypothetical protein
MTPAVLDIQMYQRRLQEPHIFLLVRQCVLEVNVWLFLWKLLSMYNFMYRPGMGVGKSEPRGGCECHGQYRFDALHLSPIDFGILVLDCGLTWKDQKKWLRTYLVINTSWRH